MNEPFVPFETVDGDPESGIILLCDHARNTVPALYGNLGLPVEQFERHIAYDIGAEALTRALAAELGCPAVHSCFSRLLIDPNRGEDDPTIVMRLSDGTVIPGNHPISAEEIAHRIKHFHAPYHQAIDALIDDVVARGVTPIIFSIHSFTHAWKGISRPWHAALLWDADPRLPRFLIDRLREDADLVIGDNEPYDGALRNDTMYRHATQNGFAQGLLEVRQDLVSDDAGIARWASILAPLLAQANQRPDMHEKRNYGSRTDGTAKDGEFT